MSWQVGPPFWVYVLAVYAAAVAAAAALQILGGILRPIIYLSLLAAVALVVADRVRYRLKRVKEAVAVFHAFLAVAAVAAVELAALLVVALAHFRGILPAIDITVAAIAGTFYIAVAGVLMVIGARRTVQHLPQGWRTPLWVRPPPPAPGAKIYRINFGGRQ